jgi:hypothetical protein
VGHTSNIKLIKVVSKRANELYKDWIKKSDRTMY